MTDRSSRPTGEAVVTQLARAAVLAGRPQIVIAEQDMPSVDRITGSRRSTRWFLDQLERADRLRPVRRGVYVLTAPTLAEEPGVLDLIGALTPGGHLVSAGRALQFHELTDQHFRRVVVLTTRQLRSWKWQGDEVRYARTTAQRLRVRATRSRRTTARVASPSRAILDSIDQPGWGVSLSQVVEALDVAIGRDPSFPDELAIDAAHLGSHALARRTGFLVSRLAGPDAARPFLPLRGKAKAATPLMAGVSPRGSIDPIWQVRENVEFERIAQRGQVSRSE